MCAPALAVASAALTAVGTGVSALQAAAQARYQANIADRNAQLEAEGAKRAQEATAENALAQAREVARARSEARAVQSANGVELGFGSAAGVTADIEMIGRENTRRIYQQGFEQMRGFDIEASNYRASAQAARQAATGALVKGAFDVTSTLLGGARQYDMLKNPVKYGSGSR